MLHGKLNHQPTGCHELAVCFRGSRSAFGPCCSDVFPAYIQHLLEVGHGIRLAESHGVNLLVAAGWTSVFRPNGSINLLSAFGNCTRHRSTHCTSRNESVWSLRDVPYGSTWVSARTCKNHVSRRCGSRLRSASSGSLSLPTRAVRHRGATGLVHVVEATIDCRAQVLVGSVGLSPFRRSSRQAAISFRRSGTGSFGGHPRG